MNRYRLYIREFTGRPSSGCCRRVEVGVGGMWGTKKRSLGGEWGPCVGSMSARERSGWGRFFQRTLMVLLRDLANNRAVTSRRYGHHLSSFCWSRVVGAAIWYWVTYILRGFSVLMAFKTTRVSKCFESGCNARDISGFLIPFSKISAV